MSSVKDLNSSDTVVYSKNNPFLARLTQRYRLNKTGSEKNTQHFVVNIAGSGLKFECGDSLGVFPTNDPLGVELFIEKLGVSANEEVVHPKTKESMSFGQALSHHFSWVQPSKKVLELFLERAEDANEKAQLTQLLDPEQAQELKAYVLTRDWVDLLEEFPSVRLAAQEVVDNLKRLLPRLYSIASSPTLCPDEIHLTVAMVEDDLHGRKRQGVASWFLADRVNLEDAKVPVFVAKSPFGLPKDDGVDAIMIGPGTGVAPFRSFLQERMARKAAGRNWLFFGEQRREFDYFYAQDWEYFQQEGLLTRLELAFSRDQEDKVYVQHKMLECAQELWGWIDSGAHIYICGDSKHMAVDVEKALCQIFIEQGGMDEAQAVQFLKDLRKEKRYQKDVY